jgi:hypothetical protein
LEAQARGPICRGNLFANARPCPPVPGSNQRHSTSGREDHLERVEVAAAPGIESLLRNGQAMMLLPAASRRRFTLSACIRS